MPDVSAARQEAEQAITQTREDHRLSTTGGVQLHCSCGLFMSGMGSFAAHLDDAIAARLFDGPHPLAVLTAAAHEERHDWFLKGAESGWRDGENAADARWNADLAPLLALLGQCANQALGLSAPCGGCYPCQLLAALPEPLHKGLTP